MADKYAQTKGRLFRATVSANDGYAHMANLRRVPGKFPHLIVERAVRTLHWSFLTPKQAAYLRGLAVTENDTTISDTVDLVESVQAL